MTRALAVLRPEPGNAATAGRIEQLGLVAVRLPLFAVRPLPWKLPDVARFDVLLLTSANTLRHGGEQLAQLRHLPVIAVGRATATAARAAGFEVRTTGTGNAATALALAGGSRVLHLTGRDHVDGAVTERIAVYASEGVPIDSRRLDGTVALIHSPRAGARLAEIVPERTKVRVAAISPAALTAAGRGWEACETAAAPTDAQVIEVARQLAD